ncbi:ornithine carbamoyltransferase [Pantoea sp. Acro-805]|uniref:Ornithine carbamoyltransferase n=1 Tax=Candidatus Pantoea formicae TaxID=2608355 RepID=A0ABX0R3I9_9GAMM|nr:ornithine carbamoyltransferase [Pantoea formicae]NIF03783.1 ornithine carbamoyltransferase [Pantoea formicae]
MNSVNLIRIDAMDPDTIEKISLRAIELSSCWQNRQMPETLYNARVGLIEELPGWRNPAAISLGGAAMGAHVTHLNARLEGSESVEDLASFLENWFDIIAIRTPSLNKLQQFSAVTNMSVINLRTHSNHPCEILGDLTYIRHLRGGWDGIHVVVIGSDANILRSWIEAASVLPIKVTQIAPPELFVPCGDIIKNFNVTDDKRLIEMADVIVTDCWPSQVSNRLKSELEKYRVDKELLSSCDADTVFIPCPPVTRGKEVSSDAMLDKRCHVKKAKAYLLHVQNAAMEFLYKNHLNSTRET